MSYRFIFVLYYCIVVASLFITYIIYSDIWRFAVSFVCRFVLSCCRFFEFYLLLCSKAMHCFYNIGC